MCTCVCTKIPPPQLMYVQYECNFPTASTKPIDYKHGPVIDQWVEGGGGGPYPENKDG